MDTTWVMRALCLFWAGADGRFELLGPHRETGGQSRYYPGGAKSRTLRKGGGERGEVGETANACYPLHESIPGGGVREGENQKRPNGTAPKIAITGRPMSSSIHSLRVTGCGPGHHDEPPRRGGPEQSV